MTPLSEQDIEYDLLIRYFIKKYGHKFYSVDDIYGTASEGLIKAIRDYRPDRGCKFKTFAFICMRRHCIKALIKSRRIKRGSQIEILSLDAPLLETDGLLLSDLVSDELYEENEESISFDTAAELIRKHLSETEYEILLLITEGYNDGEISRKLKMPHKQVTGIRKSLKFNGNVVDICVRLGVKEIKY